MKRRDFIGGLGVAALWPTVTCAQQAATPVIGFLDLGSERANHQIIEAFRSGLAALGYTEGENIRVIYRFCRR
jgi:putative ABC transport system substrate-binding protein